MQRVLIGGAAAAGEAPVWRDPARRAKVDPAAPSASGAGADILDGLVREVDRPPGRAADVEAPARGQPSVEPAPAPRRRPIDSDRPAGFSPGHYRNAAGARDYKLYRPTGRVGTPLPLIVMLHGCTQDPDDFAAGTRMNELAERTGCYVLYPAQPPRSNAHKCWNWFVPADQRRDQGEPSLLAGMTRDIVATEAIDPARVYVAGLSAGGAMAAILAREYPDLYAAAGIHSGLAAGAAHDLVSALAAMKQGVRAGRRRGAPSNADGAAVLPVIVFQGSADSTVAPVNADAVIAAALAAGVATVAEVSRPGVAPGGEPAPRRAVTRTVWRVAAAPGAASLAELWLVEAAPHAWAGGSSQGSFTDPDGPDASAEMLRFFREHPKPTRAHG